MIGRGARIEDRRGVWVVVDPTGSTRAATSLEVEMWQRLHSALPATREVYLRVNETDLRALFDELGELREALKLSSVERQKLQERLRELELQLGDEECKGALPP